MPDAYYSVPFRIRLITPLAGLILSAIGVFDAQENGKNGTLLGAFGFTLAIPLNIFVLGMVSLLLNANH